jgi:TonB-dependent SusC/RagA subfamily outer membrane receptor
MKLQIKKTNPLLATSIAVSYQALQLNILGATIIDIADISKIGISTTNTNDIFEKAKLQVAMYKLQEPTKMFRSRYWQQPDVFTMTKAEYYAIFPHDVYANENEIGNWELGTKAIEVNDSTKENGEWKIDKAKLKIGWYKITATTKDKYGEEVNAEKYIQITNVNTGIANLKDPIVVNKENKDYQPGETIKYNIQTGFDKIYLIQNTKTYRNIINTNYPIINANDNYKNSITVAEKDRGGLSMNYVFVKNNRHYEGNENFSVPWSNKDLQITYETFRDKLEPGSKEKWKIKITGNKADKVAAEALISMYDASLDQFKPHSWQAFSNIWPSNYFAEDWNTPVFTAVGSGDNFTIEQKYKIDIYKTYASILNNGWNDFNFGREYKMNRRKSAPGELSEVVVSAPMASRQAKTMSASVDAVPGVQLEAAADGVPGSTGDIKLRGNKSITADSKAIIIIDGVKADASIFSTLKPEDIISITTLTAAEATAMYGADAANGVIVVVTKNAKKNNNVEVKVRKNFNETAFFLPDVKTDANGNIEFEFTIPEALTQWKMQVLGHTKDMASGYSSKNTITQKQLMVQPNAPRFLREGDRMEFSAKVVNLTDKEVTGTTQFELIDAATNKTVDGWFKNIFPQQYFTVPAGQSVAVKFPIDVPFNYNSALLYRIKAIEKNSTFSDGEEAALPVLTNRMLVTESMPLNMRNVQSKNFKFDKLLSSASSSSLSNHALTIEYTSNPAWYVVQALPYLIEYPYECAEQTFSRYYANTLASFVTNSSPKIKEVFERWKITETAALMSNLQKNEELLQETPWVLAAQNEALQKKNIALLFDMVKLAGEKSKTLATLKELQSGNGGFVWFKGGRDDRYITQYILTGIGHLRKLNAVNTNDYEALKPIVEKALPYLDARLKDEYNDLIKYKYLTIIYRTLQFSIYICVAFLKKQILALAIK